MVHWFGRRRGKGGGVGVGSRRRGVILVVWEREENEGRLLHEVQSSIQTPKQN